MKLLIVDDGHYIVEYLKHLLDWSRYGVTRLETMINSVEARQRLAAGDVDLLITDIRMPEVSGIDLLRYISEQELKTKTIILSGYSQFDYAQNAIRLGALDYLLKPVDKDDMEKAMKQAFTCIGKEQRLTGGEEGSGSGTAVAAGQGEPEPPGNQEDGAPAPAPAAASQTKLCNTELVRFIHTYISEHLGDTLSLDDLGKAVHLHPVYLSKLYKQETGENLSGYITLKRLERAARLLTESRLHVLDIAQLVGYRKPQYFIKLFKEQYGTTPYQYRRKSVQ
ncbi:response regulator transcription factor [Paenibacillus tengchongensis]|uniref:response regulator transcription factor n=1 Tax=Paenibacillus tengchongensis TaxID=2608684 RepID=UPI001652731E|nr:response regulator [Paenibacillus tengchongensis]